MIANTHGNTMKFTYCKYTFLFRFEAGTSRGVLKTRDSYFIKLSGSEVPDIFGLGECAPLPGLSPEYDTIEDGLRKVKEQLTVMETLDLSEIPALVQENIPSLKCGLEMALLDLQNGGKRICYENIFSTGHKSIPINGLVWMGDKNTMLQRIDEKIRDGYDCIKIKIGAISFDDEVELLRHIRSSFGPGQISIRLDANGAFKPGEALQKLEVLAKFQVHSIEQPIMAGNWGDMARLCRESPVPIALDEELIGIYSLAYKQEFLHALNPSYIVLKPTLLGGFTETSEWITLADTMNTGWWITSALESNLGLNAIAQFTANYHTSMAQGLGTGQLYENNLPSPLQIKKGNLGYDVNGTWDITPIVID